MYQRTVRHLLALTGCLAIVCGVIGIFLPLLPTTPFLLLASYCFVRSSPRLHQWLLNQKHLGPIIRSFESGAGLPRQIKVRAIAIIWLSLVISMIIVGKWWSYLLLASIGSGVSIYLLKLPNADVALYSDDDVIPGSRPEITDSSTL